LTKILFSLDKNSPLSDFSFFIIKMKTTTDIHFTASPITLLSKPVRTEKVWVMFEAALNLDGGIFVIKVKAWNASFTELLDLKAGNVIGVSGLIGYID
jgi:hypothetical protein